MSWLEDSRTTKSEWRRELLRRRQDVDETTRTAEDRALREAVLRWLDSRGARTVTAYVPVGGEPASPELLDALLAAGLRVLLPVVAKGRPLDWSDYTGPDSLRPATFGLLEPAGPRLGAEAIGKADALLVPALAVDHRGVRLGRGAGHYDRSLPLAAPGAPMVGVVRDHEFVEELPGEPHDVRMTDVVTPGRGVVSLPM
ncbi:5-formyltetrahydrofolate cyclo-ligase [Saccharopolyspora thermophila]|uniref:5-formyltetrahydrofolate cyclo-ligase n=1 Tax=Saccharopolyspora thermophila TaxID=89367 RepID=UPI001E47E56C|nr:5-formyltetrahydrofolate cyclo-ligase [Saccharopolyspora subtropica]